MDVDVEEEEEDQVDPEQKQKYDEEREMLKRLPKWAFNLDPLSKKMPAVGRDLDEVAAQVFDSGIMVYMIILLDHYYNKLVWYPQQPQCFIFTNPSEVCCKAKRWKHLSMVSVN